MRKIKLRSTARKSASILPCSTLRAKSPSCAGPSSSIRNTRDAACSAPASTSRTSITDVFRSSGISSAISDTSTRSIAGLPLPTTRRPTSSAGKPSRSLGSRRSKPFPSAGPPRALLGLGFFWARAAPFLRLPARKEGIIPGAANMRMPRFTGDRIARQAVQYERRLECDSPEGRLICDEIVETGEMDAAIERVVKGLTDSGVVSAASNRRAFRIAQEPLDMFRAYFAVYAREQAYCHFSPALIANLERYWNAQSRKP